jgi:hypothetical protein
VKKYNGKEKHCCYTKKKQHCCYTMPKKNTVVIQSHKVYVNHFLKDSILTLVLTIFFLPILGDFALGVDLGISLETLVVNFDACFEVLVVNFETCFEDLGLNLEVLGVDLSSDVLGVDLD